MLLTFRFNEQRIPSNFNLNQYRRSAQQFRQIGYRPAQHVSQSSIGSRRHLSHFHALPREKGLETSRSFMCCTRCENDQFVCLHNPQRKQRNAFFPQFLSTNSVGPIISRQLKLVNVRSKFLTRKTHLYLQKNKKGEKSTCKNIFYFVKRQNGNIFILGMNMHSTWKAPTHTVAR